MTMPTLHLKSTWVPWLFLGLALLAARFLRGQDATATATPILLKSMNTLKNGTLTGLNFGTKPGKIYVVGRFDETQACEANPTSQWLQFYDCKPPGMETELPAAVISKWTDTAITLTWPKGKLEPFGKTLRVNPDVGMIDEEFPLDSVQYQIETAELARSQSK